MITHNNTLTAASCASRRTFYLSLHRYYRRLSFLLKVLILVPSLFIYPPMSEAVPAPIRYTLASIAAVVTFISSIKDYAAVSNSYQILAFSYGVVYEDIIRMIAERADDALIDGVARGRLQFLPIIMKGVVSLDEQKVIDQDVRLITGDLERERQLIQRKKELEVIQATPFTTHHAHISSGEIV